MDPEADAPSVRETEATRDLGREVIEKFSLRRERAPQVWLVSKECVSGTEDD